MTEGKVKIYCRDCLHFESLGWQAPPDIRYRCKHSDNYADTWFAEKHVRAKTPDKINCNNDCSWFEKKPEPSEKKPWWRNYWPKGSK
jgi:hypothetical protein